MRFLPNTIFCCQLLLFISAAANGHAQEQTVSLEVGYDKSQLYQTEIKIEHVGTVVIETGDQNQEPQKYPIEVQGHLKYHERFIGSPAKPQSVRLYSTAEAKMQIDQSNLNSELAKVNRLVVTRIKSDIGNKYQFASVDSVLQQKELELIKNHCDPLSFGGVLNRPDVAIGSSWEPGRDELARFLALDRVIYSTVKFQLVESSKDLAKLHVTGKLKAEVDDTLTEMAIAGVIQLDRNERMVKALRMTVNENRRAAQIAPGFEGQTKIDLSTDKAAEIKELSLEALREIAQTKTIKNVLKWVAETNSFELLYDPAWKMITAENEAAILRFVENGDLLTQCSIVRLPSRPIDKPLTLTDFKSEVAKIVAKDANSRIEQAEEGASVHGLKTLKVLVSGIEEDVRMNWLYYNVSGADGRQVTFVFMLEEQVYGRVASAAQRLVDGFVFHRPSSNLKLNDNPSDRDAKSSSGKIR